MKTYRAAIIFIVYLLLSLIYDKIRIQTATRPPLPGYVWCMFVKSLWLSAALFLTPLPRPVKFIAAWSVSVHLPDNMTTCVTLVYLTFRILNEPKISYLSLWYTWISIHLSTFISSQVSLKGFLALFNLLCRKDGALNISSCSKFKVVNFLLLMCGVISVHCSQCWLSVITPMSASPQLHVWDRILYSVIEQQSPDYFVLFLCRSKNNMWHQWKTFADSCLLVLTHFNLLAPSGAQGVTLSVCLCVCPKGLILPLRAVLATLRSVSGLSVPTLSDRRSLKHFVLFILAVIVYFHCYIFLSVENFIS